MKFAIALVALSFAAVALAAPAEQQTNWLDELKENVNRAVQSGRDFVQREMAEARKFGSTELGKLRENVEKAEKVLDEKVKEAHKFLEELGREANKQADNARVQAQKVLDDARVSLDNLRDQLKSFNPNHKDTPVVAENERSKRSVEDFTQKVKNWLDEAKKNMEKAFGKKEQNADGSREKRSISMEQVKDSVKRWATLGKEIADYLKNHANADKAELNDFRNKAPAAVQEEAAKIFDEIKNEGFDKASKDLRDDLMKVVREFYKESMVKGEDTAEVIDKFGGKFRDNVTKDLDEGHQSWENIRKKMRETADDWDRKLNPQPTEPTL